MSINLSIPEDGFGEELKPRITVIGIGGAGGNAVNDMISSGLEGVDFLVANTDAQALKGSIADRKVQMGSNITRGLGAGAKPDVGRAAAEESLDEMMELLEGANMAFIAAGMGGGTGTGAAPVIARAAREKGILTVGVVTKPFQFEGAHRMRLAEQGIEELEQYVDTLIVIPNQNLFRIANEKTTFADAFRMADEVLYSGVRGVTDLMVIPGMINLDFADIRSVMSEMGKAMMGTGEAEGERRALDAAEAAIANPLLDDSSMKGAKGVLINITGGNDMTLFEVDEATNRIRSEVDDDAYIIFGSALDNDLDGKVRVSVVATGINAEASKRAAPAILSAMERPLTPTQKIEESVEEIIDAAPMMPEVAEEASPLRFNIDADMEQPAETDSQEEIAEFLDLGSFEAEVTPEVQVKATVEAVAEADAPVIKEAVVADAVEHVPAPTIELTDVVTAPVAMPGVESTDTFIPSAPATADGKAEAKPENPFGVSDMLNGGQKDEDKPAVEDTSSKVKSRAGSLFGRIMGATKSDDAVSKPSEWNQPAPAHKTDTAASMSQPVQMPQAPAQETSGLTTQHRLGVVEQAERVPALDREEDLLDIPAFLRRQAN